MGMYLCVSVCVKKYRDIFLQMFNNCLYSSEWADMKNLIFWMIYDAV